MELSNLTLKELWSLYHSVGWEISKRLWWVYLILIIAYIGLHIYLKKWQEK